MAAERNVGFTGELDDKRALFCYAGEVLGVYNTQCFFVIHLLEMAFQNGKRDVYHCSVYH